jgi:CRP-like cAMP-binding protein
MRSDPRGKRKKFSAGKTLFEENTAARGCYVIQRGSVELSLTCCDGSCATVERVGAGSLIGVSAGFVDRKYVLTARAVSDTDTVYIPQQQVIRSLRTHPDVRMLILASLSKSVRRATECFVAAALRKNLVGKT